MEKKVFYGFRGSIIFPNQASIFSYDLKNDSVSKNKVFREFFDMIKKSRRYESNYQNRKYILLFKNQYDDIIHCQLARKSTYNRHDLVDDNIVQVTDNDYPYVTVLIDMKSQKFLIESDTKVFENYNTCESVIENIINNNLKQKDINFELNHILDQEEFWKYFGSGKKIYNIQVKLISPNIFDSGSDAEKLMMDAYNNIGCNVLTMNFANSDGELNPDYNNFNSYIKYACDGGGSWKICVADENNRKAHISSRQKSRKVYIAMTDEKLKESEMTDDKIIMIKQGFNEIESFDNLKEDV